MHLNEAAKLLKFTREEIKLAIEQGIELPISQEIVRLEAHFIGNEYDIDEESLDLFISRFHEEEPGRHPPVKVRRALLIEARHRCAICGEATPIEFHHIIEFSKVGHYDVRHMLALCPTDHTLCNGHIDQKAQYEYKRRLVEQKASETTPQFIHSIGPPYFSWDDLRQVIVELHESMVINDASGVSKFDFSEVDIDKKNDLNRLGDEYYSTVIVRHEPYFNRINNFLGNPLNTQITNLYYQIVDEIRAKIAISRDEHERFENFINIFADAAVRDQISGRSQYRRTLNILMSFMYVNCDIGRKE